MSGIFEELESLTEWNGTGCVLLETKKQDALLTAHQEALDTIARLSKERDENTDELVELRGCAEALVQAKNEGMVARTLLAKALSVLDAFKRMVNVWPEQAKLAASTADEIRAALTEQKT